MDKLLALFAQYVKDEVATNVEAHKLCVNMGIEPKVENSLFTVAEQLRDVYRQKYIDGIQVEYEVVQVVEREKTSDDRFIILTTHSIRTAVAALKAERARGHRVFIEIKHN